jgi:RNA polymerase sigma factor (sigma-70 family)
MERDEIEATLAWAAKLIRSKARRLARRGDYLRQDEEDIVQDLTARVLARLPAFDPTSRDLELFIRQVVAQGATNLLRRRHAKMREAVATSLDQAAQNGARELTVNTPESQLDTHRAVVRRDERDQADLVTDVATFLAGLPPEERLLAQALLRGGTVTGVARALGVPRRTVRAVLQRWQERARELGLHFYLGNAPPLRVRSGS